MPDIVVDENTLEHALNCMAQFDFDSHAESAIIRKAYHDAREMLHNPANSFSKRNRIRCEAKNGFNHALSSWSLSDWMTATAGELGEAANIIKKLNRVRDGIPGNTETENELREMLPGELADVAIYLDLMAQAAGLDLETIREAKFAKTSKKIGYIEQPIPTEDTK